MATFLSVIDARAMSSSEKTADATSPRDATEVRFSIRSALIAMAVVAVVTTALGAFIRQFPTDAQLRLAIYWGFLAAILLALFAYHARRRYVAESKAGRVLFELVRHSYFLPNAPRLATTLVGIVSLLAAPVVWIDGSYSIAIGSPLHLSSWQFIYATAACVATSGAGITYFWWRRVRLAENGLVLRSRFIPWEACSRWYWEACSKDVAVISCQPRSNIALRVPPQDREAIVALLEKTVFVRFKEKVSIRPFSQTRTARK